MDLQLDQGSIGKIFESKASKGGKRQMIEEFSKIMKTSKENAIQLEKIANFKAEPLILLETYKILDLQPFLSSLEVLLKDLEEFLKGKPNVKTFFALMDEEQLILLKVKIWSQFNRYRMNLLRPDEAKQCMEIFMKNGFETHGNK